uniref:ribosomal protein L20 n=1 Tax=Hydrobryum floribundum TaxID=56908 RepID=UPI0028D3058C|nr:ribosomal protein L20 [Hydrobryum floribundum]WMV01564.1 ribosomal protein L20 [Hydrobryum floribundum]WMV01641.1 ribosomal protein L20 [Hydrobryum floribundum]
MTRTRRGYIAHRRRTKIRLFTSNLGGGNSQRTRSIIQQKLRSLASAHRNRARKKRDFRRLWVTRINASIRENILFFNYNKLINNLYKSQMLINRKILAQISILNKNCLYTISTNIEKA